MATLTGLKSFYPSFETVYMRKGSCLLRSLLVQVKRSLGRTSLAACSKRFAASPRRPTPISSLAGDDSSRATAAVAPATYTAVKSQSHI